MVEDLTDPRRAEPPYVLGERAMRFTKRALDAAWDNDLETQLDLERELQREASLTPDYAEGVRAFIEKRKPIFSGRKTRG